MKNDHQATIFSLIKQNMNPKDSLGHVVGEVLSLSSDAVYRRYRGETHLTIFELEKLSKAFSISLDSVFGMNKNMVLFNFKPLAEFEFSMDVYLQDMLNNVKALKSQKNPELILTIDNTPLLQLLNYPHLIRFKLFFWAKTYLRLKEYEDVDFGYEKISSKTFDIGLEVLKTYNSIPSKEIYDPELLRGYAREIYYYYRSRLIKDADYALYLLELLDRFLDHLKAQAAIGKKFVSKSEPPAFGNNFEMYFNETNNGNSSVFYTSDAGRGLYISHNMLNYVHTTDKVYLEDSTSVIKKQLDNSSMISTINEKDRNNYFFQVKSMINGIRKKIEAESSEM